MSPQDITPLHRALADRLGVVLTPEHAVALVRAAIETFARGAKTGPGAGAAAAQAISCGAYTIGVERFADVAKEIHDLHLLHWQETERHRNHMPLDFDYGAQLLREASGRLIQITARDSCGRLVGNLRLKLAMSEHSGTWYAVEDTLFISPHCRGGMLAVRMVRYGLDVLRAIGVVEARATAKKVNRADRLLERCGFKPVATELVAIINQGVRPCALMHPTHPA